MKQWTAEEILSGIDAVSAEEADALADKMGELLAGKHPGLQGCALAGALALWLIGFEDAEVREQLLTQHLETVRELIRS
jgi:hypothetical protein